MGDGEKNAPPCSVSRRGVSNQLRMDPLYSIVPRYVPASTGIPAGRAIYATMTRVYSTPRVILITWPAAHHAS